MLDRRGFVAALMLGLVAPRAATAGVADWFNGVRIGDVLPDHDATYVQGAWDPAARLVLVDFWATWCAPCVAAIPKLNDLHDRLGPEGLQLVGITDEPAADIAAFVARKGIRYAVAAGGDKPLRSTLKIRALPYAALVDRKRRIIWRGQPDSLDEAMLREHLAAMKAVA
jgi:thiol-disulfide isomerase/thioredoxin